MGLNTKWKGQIYLKAKKTWQCCHLGRSDANVRTYDIYARKLLRY